MKEDTPVIRFQKSRRFFYEMFYFNMTVTLLTDIFKSLHFLILDNKRKIIPSHVFQKPIGSRNNNAKTNIITRLETVGPDLETFPVLVQIRVSWTALSGPEDLITFDD